MIEYRFSTSEETSELIMAELDALQFEGFWYENEVLKAYNQTETSPDIIESIVQRYKVRDWAVNPMAEINWNSVWESNYKPVHFGSQLCIHGAHHQPDSACELNILIDPKMAFGTGHHETTSLMISELLKKQVTIDSVLDNGCGSGVLAILAKKLGAQEVFAIDNDRIAVENTIENCEVNNVDGIGTLIGTAHDLEQRTFDLVISNITRNVNIDLLPKLCQLMKHDGRIWLSGFYIDDVSMVRKHAHKIGLIPNVINSKNGWALVELTL